MRLPGRWPGALLLGVLFVSGAGGNAQSTDPASRAQTEIRQTLSGFLMAFDNLDWPRFREFFAPDATMFHPAPPSEWLIDSGRGFEEAWLGVFARIKKDSGRDSAPYMNLQPQELKIHMLSSDVALVTFHLEDANVLSRRTIVFRRDGAGWKIVHIHASNLNVSPAQR
jgi:ketosteroid isomerase-like protein